MMTFWKKLPIVVQFLLLLLTAIALGTFASYRIGDKIYVAEARNQARTVADMVQNVGAWATQYNGVWVKSNPTDAKFNVGSYLEREAAAPKPDAPAAPAQPATLDQAYAMLTENGTVAYHRKNPALVQRELSDVTQASPARAKFRMTSDKFMNPNNAPTRFELAAIELLRESGDTEYSEVRGSQLYYARKLVALPGCLKCHESPEKAPAAVKAQYGQTNGFGYKEGEIAGIISVSIPLNYTVGTLLQDFDWRTWGIIGAFVFSVVLILVYVQWSIISPVRQLNAYAERAAHSEVGSDIGTVQFVEDEHGSHNEVHRLSAALKAMYTSIKLLHRQGLDRSSNVTRM